MKQMMLAAAKGYGYEKHSRATRKAEICALIEPHDPKTGNGRLLTGQVHAA